MTDLALPGDIPGLLRRGSPIVGVHTGACGVVVELQEEPKRGPGAWLAEMLGHTLSWAEATKVALDLTDATGRAHAAWWLAGRFGLSAANQIGWKYRGMWDLDGDSRRITFPKSGKGGRSLMPVPSLCDLDPFNDRLLSDGSRWVDAEALRRVCLHVAGRAA